MCLRTVIVQNQNVMNSEHLGSIKRREVSRIVEQMLHSVEFCSIEIVLGFTVCSRGSV